MVSDLNNLPDDQQTNFEHFESRVSRIIQDFIPQATLIQLFLAKDKKAQEFYTFVNSLTGDTDENLSSFASFIMDKQHVNTLDKVKKNTMSSEFEQIK